jgi:argininosuccinate synthase
MPDQIKRVVLAYSGGLDTSVILKWLQVTYNCEVVTFTADLGQGEELEPARAKAKLMGVPDAHIYIDDLREEFVRDFAEGPDGLIYVLTDGNENAVLRIEPGSLPGA